MEPFLSSGLFKRKTKKKVLASCIYHDGLVLYEKYHTQRHSDFSGSMKNALVCHEHSHMLCFMHGSGGLDDVALSRLLGNCPDSDRGTKNLEKYCDNVVIHGMCSHEVTDRVFVCLSVGTTTDSGHNSEKVIVACVDGESRGKRSKDTSHSFNMGGNHPRDSGSVVWAIDVMEKCNGLMESVENAGTIRCILSLSPADDSLCLGFSSGSIVMIELGNEVTPTSVEEVGVIDGGISSMAWSPDGEMVAIIGGYGQCLLMSSGWDVLMESHVFRIDCTDPQPTAAPEADAIEICHEADPKDWFVTHGVLSQDDASISWRGDCKYFTTVVRRDQYSPGRVRVWNVEEQDLHALGEQSPGTLPVLAWQPQGRVLCVANFLQEEQAEEVHSLRQMTHTEGDQGQAPEVRHVGAWKRELKRREEAARKMGSDALAPSKVFLYERNGLQHGEFVIPGSSNGIIERMEWSSDSKTLAIVLRHEKGTQMSVQVWCRSNWKWYNKFTRTFCGLRNIHVMWQDTVHGTDLCMLTSRGLLSRVCLTWGYTTSGYGTVAVVDGGSLMLTPMRQCRIPPPMCAVSLTCGKPITSVDFTRLGENEVVGALLADGSLAYAVCRDKDDWESAINEVGEGIEGDTDVPLNILKPKFTNVLESGGEEVQYRHIAWFNSCHLVLIGQSPQGTDCIFEYCIDLESGRMDLMHCVELGCYVAMITSDFNAHQEKVLIEFEDGSCQYYTGSGILTPAPSFDSRCDTITSYNNQIVGLDKNGQLQLNGSVIASDVTSFGIHAKSSGGPHLLYTSKSNFIRTLPLASLLVHGAPKPRQGDITLRAIEDGCVIVSCPSESVDVILQAPRGNLEIIRPRALVLPAVVQALDAGDYRKAWNLASVNRLDLNILADYRWPSLVENVASFMNSVGSDVEVSGFLQSLSSNSVLGKGGVYSTVIMYDDTKEPIDKIVTICTAVQSYIKELHQDSEQRNWMCTELTAHTKCGNIGKALLRVKDIKEDDLNIINNQGLAHAPKISAESGLKHILLHNPENDVYNAALGEYELELAYMVVSHIQRDPGEYLVQLQEFATIQNNSIRKAAIDRHLGRYNLALEHLYQAGPDSFNEALDLARERDLLRHLLSLVNEEESKNIVYKALGDALSHKGKYEDAALAYVAGKDLEQALRSYRLAGAWKPAMTLAARLGKDQHSIKDLATRMANDLDDSQNYEEAAQLTLEYLRNVPNAVRLYANAGNWREGLRVATNLGDMEMVNSILAPIAASAAERLLESFKDDTDRVAKYWTRLKELRERRAAMEALKEAADADAELENRTNRGDYADEETASMITDMSVYTDASLATTTASGTSFATTVGGRKGLKKDKQKKKKKNKVRQGSPEEEAQLAKHILSLLPLPEVCTETGQLSEFLVFIGHEDDASILQRSLKTLIDRQAEAASDILSHPPPGKSFELPYEIRERIFNKAGLEILDIVDKSIFSQACPDLQIQIKEAELAMKNVHWKWELLRDP